MVDDIIDVVSPITPMDVRRRAMPAAGGPFNLVDRVADSAEAQAESRANAGAMTDAQSAKRLQSAKCQAGR